jgi:hypothetical protein
MRLSSFALVSLVILASAGVVLADGSLVLEANMKELHAKMPDAANRFVASSAPGQIFLPGETANVTLLLSKGPDQGTKQFEIEVQEITTRDPERKVEGEKGFSDTAGRAASRSKSPSRTSRKPRWK